MLSVDQYDPTQTNSYRRCHKIAFVVQCNNPLYSVEVNNREQSIYSYRNFGEAKHENRKISLRKVQKDNEKRRYRQLWEIVQNNPVKPTQFTIYFQRKLQSKRTLTLYSVCRNYDYET